MKPFKRYEEEGEVDTEQPARHATPGVGRAAKQRKATDGRRQAMESTACPRPAAQKG